MQARVEVDKRQILTLLGCEGFCRATHVGHPIQLLVRASNEEAWMNVRYRVELSQTERAELTALLRAWPEQKTMLAACCTICARCR
jgi:hypothetical protein